MLLSTIASEVAFNTSGHVLNPYKSPLNARKVEDLIYTQKATFNKALIANPSSSSSCSTSFDFTVEEMSLHDMLKLGDSYNSYMIKYDYLFCSDILYLNMHL